MYYCTDKASEYPLILGAERCKMITRTRSSLNTVKGWCLDNDIPAQYWFSTPVTVSGSHNRSCSCSHPGTHQAIINTSRTLILFIYSFSVLYFVPKSWQTFTRYTSDKLLWVHYSLRWSHSDHGEHWGVACGCCCWYHHKTLTTGWLWTLSRFIFDFYTTCARHWEQSRWYLGVYRTRRCGVLL